MKTKKKTLKWKSSSTNDFIPVLQNKRARPSCNHFANLESCKDLNNNAIQYSSDENISFDPVIEECMYSGLKAPSIMRILNTFIMAKKMPDDFFGTSKVRSRMYTILSNKKENITNLRYLAFDGRKDNTLFPKNQYRMAQCSVD